MRCSSVLLILATLTAQAQQPGTLDQSFNAQDTLIGQGNGPYVPDASPIRMALLPDGKILLGGSMNNYNGTGSPGLVRVLPNGLADPTFNSGLPANTIVNALAPEPDGQVVYATIGGVFRRNANGTADAGFDDGTGPGGGQVRAIAVQTDGRIIVAGQFTTFNGAPRSRIARLNSDGSLDASFLPGLAFNNTIWSIALTTTGQVIVAGAFTNTGYAFVARLNNDGSLDAGFVPPAGITGVINDVVALANGQVLIGGSFDGIGFGDLARLNSNGTWDQTFATTYFIGSDPVRKLIPYSDGRCLVVGDFLNYGSESLNRIMRLFPNGMRDTSFQPNGGFGAISVEAPSSAVVLPTGEILVANGRRYREVPCPRLIKLMDNGAPDFTFNRITGQNLWPRRIVAQADGKILVSGADLHQGLPYPKLIRLLDNGDRDPAFNIGTGPRDANGALGNVNGMAPLADGRVVVCGWFTQFNGVAAPNIVRLLPGGAVDPTFTVGTGPNNSVNEVLQTADGKLVLFGTFTSFNGTAVNGLVRLNADGALDNGFVAPTMNGLITTFDLAPGGKLVIGGVFTSLGGFTRNRIARLLPNGSVDPTFDPAAGPSTYPASLAVQPDGRVVACGPFTSVSGVSRNHLVRFNNDGSLDASFDPGSGFSGSPQIPVRVRLQPDGRILVGGAFYTYNGHSQEALIRLESNGSVDLTFQGEGFDIHHRGLSSWNYSQVVDMAVQNDGKILAVGYFDSYDSEACNTIARLHGGSVAGLALSVRAKLQGPLAASGASMSGTLKQLGLVPTTEPYTALGYTHVGGGGGESFDPIAFQNIGFTDWVVLELRSASDPFIVLYSRSCLLRSNGVIVGSIQATSGSDQVPLPTLNAPAGNYYVAIRHRNHLGIMTAAPVSLSSFTTVIDLTSPTTAIWGFDARVSVNGVMALWQGDVTGDGVVSYTGQNNDRDVVLQAVGGVTPTNTVTGYLGADINLDGIVRYTGANNDRDLILQTIGGVVPTATRLQQLP